MLSSTDPQKSADIATFWRMLSIFWGQGKAEEWKRQMFPSFGNPDIGVDEVFNLICLDAPGT